MTHARLFCSHQALSNENMHLRTQLTIMLHSRYADEEDDDNFVQPGARGADGGEDDEEGDEESDDGYDDDGGQDGEDYDFADGDSARSPARSVPAAPVATLPGRDAEPLGALAGSHVGSASEIYEDDYEDESQVLASQAGFDSQYSMQFASVAESEIPEDE